MLACPDRPVQDAVAARGRSGWRRGQGSGRQARATVTEGGVQPLFENLAKIEAARRRRELRERSAGQGFDRLFSRARSP